VHPERGSAQERVVQRDAVQAVGPGLGLVLIWLQTADTVNLKGIDKWPAREISGGRLEHVAPSTARVAGDLPSAVW
jgi:hypothetical protein